MSVCIEIKNREDDYCIGQQCTPRGAGCTGGETMEKKKNRTSQDRTMEPVYHGSYPRTCIHTYTHAHIRTCHVLLLFITIIVTTGALCL